MMLKKIFSIFGKGKKQPALDTALLYTGVKENLKGTCQKLKFLSRRLDNASAKTRTVADHIFGQARQRLSEVEQELELLRTQDELTQQTVAALGEKILSVQNSLSLLQRRHTHQKNLDRLNKQLSAQQLTTLTDEMRAKLQTSIRFEEAQIQLLEAKEQVEPKEQEKLATHRHNSKLYQEMLAGERPYAPLGLLNQIAFEEQALKAIDAKLGRL